VTHGAKAIGRKIKKVHRTAVAGRAVRKKIKTLKRTPSPQPLSAGLTPQSDILVEFTTGIKNKVKGMRAGRSIYLKMRAAKLQKMNKADAKVKQAKTTRKLIRKGKHFGEVT